MAKEGSSQGALEADFSSKVSLETDEEKGEELSEEVLMMISMLGNEHKAYWNTRYIKEMDRLCKAKADGAEDPLEQLFVWFGKMPLLLAAQTVANELPGVNPASSQVLDLGCGNGFFCEILNALGFANVTGMDYSPSAVRCSLWVQEFYMQQKTEKCLFQNAYILDDFLHTKLQREFFDVIHDSGTLDSIAMTAPDGSAQDPNPFAPPQPPPVFDEDKPEEADLTRGPEPPLYQGAGAEGYFKNLNAILRPGGYFFVRSCNHSKDELMGLIKRSGLQLSLFKDVSLEGTDVRSVVFQKPEIHTAPSA